LEDALVFRKQQPADRSGCRMLRVAAIAAAVLLQICPTVRAEENAGAVRDLIGVAFAQAGATQRTLALQAPVLIGDHVSTGALSRLTMLLGRDTTVRLGERGSVVIDRFLASAGGEITLQSGPMLFERPEGSAPLPVKIRSQYGLIAVRGTRLFAGPDGNALGVFVERGEASVLAAGRRVVLRSGQGTTIPAPGAKPGEIKQWAPARIDALFGAIR
jgi:ferric-dicitrate binding protein FerR (iron transport regulator)